jgi:hypothetical protein
MLVFRTALLLAFWFSAPAAGQDYAKQPPAERQTRIWTLLKRDLTGPNGSEYFKENLLYNEIPGGALGLYEFTGTVLASTALRNGASAVILALSDKTTPEVNLRINLALTEKLSPDTQIEFSGVGESFRVNPFMLNLTATRFRRLPPK